MLFRKPKRGRYRIAMGPRALTASSGLAPWSMVVDRVFGSVEKNPTAAMDKYHHLCASVKIPRMQLAAEEPHKPEH